MKRIFFAMTLALSLCTLTAAANDNLISKAVLEKFQSSFSQAQGVTWSVSENLFKAEFALNGQHIAAYYNQEGQLVGMTRNLSSLQLPMTLQAKLKREFEEYWISDLFEFATDEGSTYYVTLENAETKLVLKAGSNSEWSTFKKQRKS